MPGLTESWITTRGSRLIYETLSGKEVVYVLLISSVLGRLPVVWGGDMGTIPHKHRAGLCSGAHRFDPDLARADSAPGSWDCCPNILCPFLGFRLVRQCVNKVSIKPLSYCNTGYYWRVFSEEMLSNMQQYKVFIACCCKHEHYCLRLFSLCKQG